MSSPHKAFYDERWAGFQYANRLKMARATAILEEILRTERFEPRIIDLGCGAGWLTSILGMFGPATGVDLSDHALKHGVAHPHVQFLQANILEWDHPEKAFDIVVSQEVIEHLDDSGQERYLEIASKLLCPGGHLILTTPNSATFSAMPAHQRESWGDQMIENKLNRTRLRKLLERRFEGVRVGSVIAGYGSAGLYRVFASRKLRRLVNVVLGPQTFETLACRTGFGLHLVASGRTPA